jgi:hypothetical protein
MSETEIGVDGLSTARPAPQEVERIRVEEKADDLVTITSTNNLDTTFLMLPEEDAVELAEAITATVED